MEILRRNPVRGLQVGSGAGSSAVEWGKLVKETGGVVLCIDPWVGDLPMWYSEGWREAMAWEDGQVGFPLPFPPSSQHCSPAFNPQVELAEAGILSAEE